MRVKTTIFRAAQAIGRGLERWLELLGQHPSPARDHGLCAWHYMREYQGPPGGAPAFPGASPLGQAVDDPHMPVGIG